MRPRAGYERAGGLRNVSGSIGAVKNRVGKAQLFCYSMWLVTLRKYRYNETKCIGVV